MRVTLPIVCAAFLPLVGSLWADDYPQWRGPKRDGVSAEKGLLQKWPSGGPKQAWKITGLGGGYSTVAVAKGRIYTMGEKSGQDYVIALEEKDGKEVWSKALGKTGKNPSGNDWHGPRCTPTVDGDKVYALASDGDLGCLDIKDGAIVWKKNLKSDFGGKTGTWVYSESPLIDGDKLVVTPGGASATLVALDRKDGKVIWKSAVPGGDKAAYSSVIIGETGGVRQYIQVVHNGAIGVDAKTGTFLWRFKAGTNTVANIPTPIYHDSTVFVLNGYGAGAAFAKLSADGDKVTAKEGATIKQLASQIGGAVRVGDHVYGVGKGLMCIEWATGKEKWTNKSVGAAALCYADGQLYVRGQGGAIALVEATPTAYKENGRFTQPNRSQKEPAWAYPVVANGHLYLRDMGTLLCYEVKAEGK